MKIELIPGWQLWYRRGTSWLAGLNATLITYVFATHTDLLVGLIGFAPDGWQIPLAIGLGLLAFALPVLVAHLRQPALERRRAELRQQKETT